MLKKKYNLQKQLVIKHNYIKNHVTLVIQKSLGANHFIKPMERISFLAQSETSQTLFFRFSTLQKLHCLITLSPKVHNKAFYYSRFFLNKQLDKLTIANTLK